MRQRQETASNVLTSYVRTSYVSLRRLTFPIGKALVYVSLRLTLATLATTLFAVWLLFIPVRYVLRRILDRQERRHDD